MSDFNVQYFYGLRNFIDQGPFTDEVKRSFIILLTMFHAREAVKHNVFLTSAQPCKYESETRHAVRSRN